MKISNNMLFWALIAGVVFLPYIVQSRRHIVIPSDEPLMIRG